VPQHHGLLAAYLALSGCTAADPNDDLVWAINLGGSAHMALDGTEYGAEVSVSGGREFRMVSTTSHSISPSRSRSAVESAYSTVLPKSSA
jgi:hypothetical protein